jgi:hypothetical protein
MPPQGKQHTPAIALAIACCFGSAFCPGNKPDQTRPALFITYGGSTDMCVVSVLRLYNVFLRKLTATIRQGGFLVGLH